MKKNKAQKGITLIALIITIVVLLILAAVAISSIQKNSILSYAQNAADNWNKAAQNEANMLEHYLNYLNNIGDATVGTKVQKLSTINGQQYSANNPVIPAGFIAINTTTSNWDATDLAAEVKKGLVITDSVDSEGKSNGSEFVWIPVANISEMAKVTSGTDANKRTNYEGLNYGEPANLIATNTYADNKDRFTLPTIKNVWDKDYYQEAFNKMVESVIEYKGFYIGRYEMSYNTTTNKAESRSGATSVYNDSDANNWWGLYEKATTYSTSGVISEMIWGCQYDAMLRWMQRNNIDVTSSTPTDTNRNAKASRNTSRVTGSSSGDILNNIYDILGNSFEWTQEAFGDYCNRCYRGGYYTGSYSPTLHSYEKPTDTRGSRGSRLTLYVEI